MRLLALLMLSAGVWAQSISDDALWKDFVAWSASIRPLPPGERKFMRDAYVQHAEVAGVSGQEAAERFARLDKLRRASAENEAVYWNASFKLGGGPNAPLRLLQEAVYKRKPGRALDSGMGRGRNAIYLASTGWEVTGYDMAADALSVAQTYAAEAGAKIITKQAKHEDFRFGENEWDLILCSYNYMSPLDAEWPAVFGKALRPGGIVVFQTSVGPEVNIPALVDNWKRFELLRVERLDAGVIDDDWVPSITFPTIRLVVRKK